MKKRKGSGTVPVQDLGLNKLPTPEELYRNFQLKGRYTNKGSDEDLVGGGQDGVMHTRGKAPDFALPPHDEIKHGEVKAYTAEEIAEYEKQRDWVQEAEDDKAE